MTYLPRLRQTILALTLVAITSALSTAQGIITGSISGTVVDATSAILPGATIVASRKDTNANYTATSNADGTFSINDMQVGSYTVTVSGAGFSTLSLNSVLVDANRVQALGNEVLKSGGASESVEVSATSSLLETTASQVTTTFDSQALVNLPTAGGFDELTLLIPGVVNTHANNFSNTNGVGFSVNGQPGRSNNFELDGQSNNDNSIGGPQFFFQTMKRLPSFKS